MHSEATEPRQRLRVLPLLVTVLLGLVLAIGSALAGALFSRALHLSSPTQSLLKFLYVQHGFQLLFAHIGIAALKKWYAPADFGLHRPRGKRHFLPALAWSFALATVVNAGNS